MRLAIVFQNNDAAATTVDGLSVELWFSPTEKAEELELLEWSIEDENHSYRAEHHIDLEIPVPGRTKAGPYILLVRKKYAAEARVKAKSEEAFLRFTARSLGNPDWSCNILVKDFDQYR